MHLVCLTIDTDPDGLAGREVNRQTLVWKALEQIQPLLDARATLRSKWKILPITWFVRADGQLRDVLGSPLYLLEKFQSLWTEVQAEGDEIGWHPHLYRQACGTDTASLIVDPREGVEELERLWDALSGASIPFQSFRNGEGWHYRETLETVERLGFRWDCTALPGVQGSNGHPMNWLGAPNHPYFPDRNDIRRPGGARKLLEIPMNTWPLKAPYDRKPRLRYMNPAVHEELFQSGVDSLKGSLGRGLHIWSLILHPDEVFAQTGSDYLYARSAEAVRRNLQTLVVFLEQEGDTVHFTTISEAGNVWLSQTGSL
jgi:hypothetical protein